MLEILHKSLFKVVNRPIASFQWVSSCRLATTIMIDSLCVKHTLGWDAWHRQLQGILRH